jgi:signal transduction histidine kinase/CheY-like chemotaxis protein/HAMP domain-containing protein
MTPSLFRWPPRRVGIFAQLLLAFLLVALLPLTTFWQFERTRSTADGRDGAHERLKLFSDRVVQQVNDWTQQNLAALKLAASLPEAVSMSPEAHKRLAVLVARQLPWAYLVHSANLAGMNVARSDDLPLASYGFRTYYQDVLRGADYSAEIQIGLTSQKPAFHMAVPIRDPQGELRGVLIEAATLDAVSKAVTSANLGRTGFAFLMTPEGRLIANAHEPSNQYLKDYSKHPAFAAAKAGKDGIQHYVVDGIERTAMIRRTDLGWIAVAQQNTQETLAGVTLANRSALVLLVATAALVTLLSSVVARGFAGPIERVTAVANQISRGNLDFTISTRRRDQIGDLVRAMNGVRETLRRFVAALAAVAKGDLTVQMEGSYEGTFADLKRDINTTVGSLAALIHQIELNRGLLRATLEHLPQGVSVVDADLRLIAWNRRYREIFDYPDDLVHVGQSVEVLMRYNAARGLFGRGDVEENIRRRTHHLRTGSTHAHERELPGGVVLEIRGSPVPGVGYATSYTDVSAYKRVEEKLRALAESLERRVSERTEDLQRAMAKADRANRSKSKFLAAAVHDLSQPINAARLYVSALKQDLRNQPAANLAAHAEHSLSSVEGLLASLMDVARLESGRLKLKVEDARLGPVLESLSHEFRILAQSRGLQLHGVMTRAVVRTDMALLRRVLQNFLSNAVRYTSSGRILLGVRHVRHGLRIEVWDTGCGIAADKTEEIFEEFRRLDSQQPSAERGAGLGLAIVRTIAGLLHHTVAVRSWPARGSVFSIEVPRGDGSRLQESAALAPIAEEALFRRRIWCIDDDHDVREATRTLLERWGCEVTLCVSGDDCLQTARRTGVPDLLILDYRLGDHAGPDLLPELESIWRRTVPVVIVSGEHPTLLREALGDAPWPVLAKPIRPEELRAGMLAMLDMETADT